MKLNFWQWLGLGLLVLGGGLWIYENSASKSTPPPTTPTTTQPTTQAG